jgi:predicted regulator of Ras-like GTPase activity (Roadblock/LC7/MglB family)
LGRGTLEQVYIKGGSGAILLTSIGSEAVLTALARQDAKLGMLFLEMRRAAEDISKLVG